MDDAQTRTTEKAIRPVWRPAFLSALRETGVVRDACEAAGIGRRTAYDARERDPAFRADWDEAMQEAADLLEREAVRRARIGVRKPVIHQGRMSGAWVDAGGNVVADNTPGSRLVPLAVTEYDTALLIFLLKGARPEKFRDNARVVHAGDPAAPVKVEHEHRHSLTAEDVAFVESLLGHAAAGGGVRPDGGPPPG